MPEPKHHAENRGWIETILGYIPGFRGYLKKENRREADELQRHWLAERLQRAKRGLDAYALARTNAGNLEDLPEIERLRSKLDLILARIRGAMQGYSGFFDLVVVDEAILDSIYELEVTMMKDVGTLADEIEALRDSNADAKTTIPPLISQLESIADTWDHREDVLKGF